jgi:hypothetical protein
MPNLEELSRAIAAYHNGRLRLGAFEDWFRDNSRGMFGEEEDVLQACIAIEAAFSRYYFEGISEEDLRRELAAAVYPFEEQRIFVYGRPQAESSKPAVLRRPLRLQLSLVV